jgi:hypothetical protein
MALFPASLKAERREKFRGEGEMLREEREERNLEQRSGERRKQRRERREYSACINGLIPGLLQSSR